MSHSSTAPRGAGHVVVAATIGVTLSLLGFVFVAICAAALSGRTVAGGERAVVGAAIADVAIVIGSTIGLAYYARNATAATRWLSVAVYAVADLIACAGMLLMTVLVLNR